MATAAATPAPPRQALAPAWHTVLLIVVMLLLSFAGSKSTHPVETRYGHVAQYALQMASEWIFVLYVWWGLRLRDRPLRELIGGKWSSFEDILLDVAIAAGFWVVALAVLAALAFALRQTGPRGLEQIRRAIEFLAPQTGIQLAVFLGLALTAGFCEEVIFRGYFQQQFAAWTNAAGGIIVSGLLFGAAHGYQGWKQMVRIAVFGMMFGIMAHFRKSLRPGMIAHAWQDGLAGVALYVFYRLKLFK
jgi:CAAX protease family protein